MSVIAREYQQFVGKNLEEASQAAEKTFSLPAKFLDIQVLDKGSGGFFGMGSRPASIKARASVLAAVMQGSAEDVKALATSGANVRAVVDDITPIMSASSNGQLDKVQILLDAGLKPKEETDRCGISLLLAASGGHTDVVEALVKAGTNVNYHDTAGATALTYAIEKNHIETAQKLLSLKANANSKSDNNLTVLMFAAIQGCPEITNALLTAGAKPNAEVFSNGWNWRALDFALPEKDPGEKNYAVALALAKAGARTGMDKTAMIAMASKGAVDAMKYLIQGGLNVNEKVDGHSPLLEAVNSGHLEVVKVLIGAGANINDTDTPGWTPLMYASYNGNAEVVKALLAAGASFTTKSKDGATALSLAKNKGNAEIVKMLEAAGEKN